jgi:hypothetical protein
VDRARRPGGFNFSTMKPPSCLLAMKMMDRLNH